MNPEGIIVAILLAVCGALFALLPIIVVALVSQHDELPDDGEWLS